eukprot:42750_1
MSDFGDDSDHGAGGVRYIKYDDETTAQNVPIHTVNINKPHPCGIAIFEHPIHKMPCMYVSYPLADEKSILWVENLFEPKNVLIKYHIGANHHDCDINADGPYHVAHAVGARCVSSIGSSAFFIQTGRIKYIMDISSQEYGLPRWMKILRDCIQHPFGFIDEYQKSYLNKVQFELYYKPIRYPTDQQIQQNIEKINTGTKLLLEMAEQRQQTIIKQ